MEAVGSERHHLTKTHINAAVILFKSGGFLLTFIANKPFELVYQVVQNVQIVSGGLQWYGNLMSCS